MYGKLPKLLEIAYWKLCRLWANIAHKTDFAILTVLCVSPAELCALLINPQDIEILGWCPAGPVLPHVEKVPL